MEKTRNFWSNIELRRADEFYKNRISICMTDIVACIILLRSPLLLIINFQSRDSQGSAANVLIFENLIFFSDLAAAAGENGDILIP